MSSLFIDHELQKLESRLQKYSDEELKALKAQLFSYMEMKLLPGFREQAKELIYEIEWILDKRGQNRSMEQDIEMRNNILDIMERR